MKKSKEIKEAVTAYPVHELIRHRWSARSFSPNPVRENDIGSLFEAARWSASSMNEQPWIYLYATADHQEEYEKFNACLLPGNRIWAGKAPLLILSLASRIFTRNGEQNRHALHDVGAANTSLLIQASSMGIFGHMIGGFDYIRTIETFGLPEHIEPVCFIALGYLDEAEKLEEPFRTRELTARTRKELGEFVHRGSLEGKTGL